MFEKNELPKGWIALDEKTANTIVKELKKEVPKGHVLYGLDYVALAKHENSDDYLFSVVGANAPLYSVHLTWSKESDPFWPASVQFENKDTFIHGWKKIFE